MGIEEGEMSFIHYFNTSKIYYEGFLWGLILKSRKDPSLSLGYADLLKLLW